MTLPTLICKPPTDAWPPKPRGARTANVSTRYSLLSRASLSSPNASCVSSAAEPCPAHSSLNSAPGNPCPSSSAAPTRSAHPSTKPTTPATVPKGNPDLGPQLAHLSKVNCKAAKAVNPGHLKPSCFARRLVKKKVHNVLPIPEQRKDCTHVWKNTAEHKASGAAAPQKKSWLCSKQSVARRNTKKTMLFTVIVIVLHHIIHVLSYCFILQSLPSKPPSRVVRDDGTDAWNGIPEVGHALAHHLSRSASVSRLG